jgi:hypothetical protein
VKSKNAYSEFVGFNAERELHAGSEKIEELLSNYPLEGTHVFAAFDQQKLIGVAAISRRLSLKYRHKAFFVAYMSHQNTNTLFTSILIHKAGDDEA